MPPIRLTQAEAGNFFKDYIRAKGEVRKQFPGLEKEVESLYDILKAAIARSASTGSTEVQFTPQERQSLAEKYSLITLLMTGSIPSAVEGYFKAIEVDDGSTSTTSPDGSMDISSAGNIEASRKVEAQALKTFRLFTIFVREKRGYQEFFRIRSVTGEWREIDPEKVDYSPEERAKIQTDFDIAIARILIDVALAEKASPRGSFAVAAGTWSKENSEFFTLPGYDSPNVPRRALQYRDLMPGKFQEYFNSSLGRLDALVGAFNLANDMGSGGSRVPFNDQLSVFKQGAKADKSVLQSGNFRGNFSEIRRFDHFSRENPLMKTEWIFGHATRLAIFLQHRASVIPGYRDIVRDPVTGSVVSQIEITSGAPYTLNNQASAMYDAVMEAVKTRYLWSQERPRKEDGKPIDLTENERWQLERGVQWSIHIARGHLIEPALDRNAMEFESSQLLNAFYYHGLTEKKTVLSAISNKFYSPDVGRIRPRYLESIEGFSKMYALVPAEAVQIYSTAADIKRYLEDELNAKYGSAAKKRDSLEYRDALRMFTQYEYFDPSLQPDYEAIARKCVVIKVKPEYQQIQGAETYGDALFLPRHSVTPEAGGKYFRIRASIFDLLYRAQLAESHVKEGVVEPILLYETIPDAVMSNYDNFMDYEYNGWYELNTVKKEGKPSEAVIKDIRKLPTPVEVVKNPFMYGRRIKAALLGARALVAEKVGFVSESLEESIAGVRADEPHTFEDVSMAFSRNIMSQLGVREGSANITQAQDMGWSKFRNDLIQYWTQRMEAVNPGRRPVVEYTTLPSGETGIKEISFVQSLIQEEAELGERDLSFLRKLIADVSHDDLSKAYFFPHRLDHWISQAEKLPAKKGSDSLEVKKLRAQVNMGIQLELILLASMIYLNRYRYEEIKTEHKTLAQYDEIRLTTLSGHDPLSPTDLVAYKEVLWTYIRDMVRDTLFSYLANERGYTSKASIPDSDIDEFLDSARSKTEPSDIEFPDNMWYTYYEIEAILLAQYKRLGIVGSFESLAAHMQFKKYKFDKVPTVEDLHHKDQKEKSK